MTLLVSSEATSGLLGLFGQARIVVALVVLAVLAYWTVERALGQGDDPTLRHTSSSDTGTVSVLLSGTNAVLLLVAIGVLALAPEIAQGNPLLLGVFAAIGVLHWYFEKEEREA